MITKEVTICGKQVIFGYCYATEIAYQHLANEDLQDYACHAVEAIKAKHSPDVKRTIYAILACMIAYYEDENKTPVTDREIMKEAKPSELAAATVAILNMRGEFYYLPSDEPKDKKAGRKPKNA